MAAIDSYEFRIVRPNELTREQRRELGWRAYYSFIADFKRPHEETQHMVRFASKTRRNLNRGVGTSQLRDKLQFARQHSVVAIHRDKLTIGAHLTVADVASSKHGGPRGILERAGKLGLSNEEALLHRYYWAGQLVLSEEARHVLEDTPADEASIIDVLLTKGAEGKDSLQPGSAYPYMGEWLWTKGLHGLGYTRTTTDSEEIYAFGPEAPAIEQTEWRVASLGVLREYAYAKSGLEAALTQES